MKLKQLEQWQLTKLVDHMFRVRPAELVIVGFKIHEGGISELAITPGYIRERKTLGTVELKWYSDTFFRRPHCAVQVSFKDNVVVVGFWAKDYEGLKRLIEEKTDDVTDTNSDSSWSLSGKIRLETDPTSPDLNGLSTD